MNRAEARRLNRENNKKQVTYTLTNADIARIKKEALDEASRRAFIVLMGLPLMTLRDKFGFGKIRLERFSDNLIEIYDAFDKGYITLEDLTKTLKEETGVEVQQY